ncbi:MAG: peptidoglycan recognition protein family protein [Candidatus Thorarchaeota archaeon]|jgi:hypothetical protein
MNLRSQSTTVVAGLATGLLADFILRKSIPKETPARRLLYGQSPLAFLGGVYGYANDDARGWQFAAGVAGSALLTYLTSDRSGAIQASSALELDDAIIVDGNREPIATQGLFRVEDFTERPERSLMGKQGRHYTRRVPVKYIVFHHGGFDVDHLYRAFQDPNRPFISSHFGIGLDPNGEVVVAQYLDTAQVANHAGEHNENSIGIDFAISPLPQNAARYGLSTTTNPTRFGPREVTDFPDSVVDAAAQLVRELHRIYGISTKFSDVGESGITVDELLRGKHSDVTVVSHHNLSSRGKFDVAYLWDRLRAAHNQGSIV